VNSLPKTVTRQRRSCDLNHSAPEFSTLTTRLPIHPTLYMGGKVSMVFNRNCFFKNKRLFKDKCPTGSYVNRKRGSINKWREIDTLLLHTTNRNY